MCMPNQFQLVGNFLVIDPESAADLRGCIGQNHTIKVAILILYLLLTKGNRNGL